MSGRGGLWFGLQGILGHRCLELIVNINHRMFPFTLLTVSLASLDGCQSATACKECSSPATPDPGLSEVVPDRKESCASRCAPLNTLQACRVWTIFTESVRYGITRIWCRNQESERMRRKRKQGRMRTHSSKNLPRHPPAPYAKAAIGLLVGYNVGLYNMR